MRQKLNIDNFSSNPFLNMNIPLINAASILSQQQCTTVPKSQIPFNPLMIPSFGPNIAPSIFAQSASPPSFEMPPVPKTLEELLEFQWMHTAHILVSQDDRKSVSFLLQKLHGLMNEKQKLVKEVKDLHQKVDLFDSTLKMVKEIVAVSKQVSEDDSELLMLTEKVNSKNNEEFDENKSINTSVQPRINSSTSQTPPNNQQISSTIKSGSSTPVNSLMNSSNSSTNAFNTSLNNILAATSRLRSSMTENNVTSDLNGISQSSRRSSLNSAPEITGTGSVTQANTDQSLILNNNSPNSPQTLNQSISSTPSLSNSLSNVATNNNIINPVVQDQYLRYLSKQLNSTSNVSPHNLPPTSGFNPNLYNSRNNGTTSNNSNNVNNLGPSLPFGGFDHPSQTHHLESTGHIKSHVGNSSPIMNMHTVTSQSGHHYHSQSKSALQQSANLLLNNNNSPAVSNGSIFDHHTHQQQSSFLNHYEQTQQHNSTSTTGNYHHRSRTLRSSSSTSAIANGPMNSSSGTVTVNSQQNSTNATNAHLNQFQQYPQPQHFNSNHHQYYISGGHNAKN